MALLFVASFAPIASASSASSAARSHEMAVAVQAATPVGSETTTVIRPPGASPDAPIGVGAYICTIVSGTGFTTGEAAVVGYAYTTDCSGASVCFQTADLQQYQGRITGGWTALATGPQTDGCTEGSASVVSEGCTSSSLLWEYRTLGYYTVYWDNGNVSNGSLYSNVVSADRVC